MKNLKAVQVEFNEHGRPYTYKTFDTYEIGDHCVVDSPSEGLVVVEVVGTDITQLEDNRRYKWVVQKVDTTEYEELNAREEMAIMDLAGLIQENNRRETIKRIETILGEENQEGLKQLARSLNAPKE